MICYFVGIVSNLSVLGRTLFFPRPHLGRICLDSAQIGGRGFSMGEAPEIVSPKLEKVLPVGFDLESMDCQTATILGAKTIAVLEEQKDKAEEKVDDETKTTDADPSGTGPTSMGDDFDGKPDTNDMPMEEIQFCRREAVSRDFFDVEFV